ncbi:MAG: ABC transporter ATP-binding protein, partial [Pseudomonadota bacterium]
MADTNTPSTVPAPGETRPLIKRLITGYMRPQWPRILAAFICMALAAAATGAMARIMEPIIDTVFAERDRTMLLPIALAVLAIFVVKGLASYGQAVLMADVGRNIIARLQSQMFSTVVRADLAAFHATASGRLVSRFTFDVQQLYEAVSKAITGIGKDALTLIALVAVMISIDPLLSLVALVIFPAAFIPIIRLGRHIRKVTRKTQDEYGLLTARLSQIFQGIRHVKAYGAEDREAERTDAVINKVATLYRKTARIASASHPIMESLGGIAIVAVILYGGNAVISGERTTGSFFAFITALLLAYEPAKKIARLNSTLQQGVAAAQRVFETIDSQPAITDAPGAPALIIDNKAGPAGRIDFQGVHFHYGHEAPALHGIDLTVPAGQTVGIVGPSGAGKSTVLNLIPRFYDVSAGSVRIDGHDVREVTLASLREAIALVSQEVTLFDDTVSENIAFGRPEASQAEVEDAARIAAAHDFIQALPEGYDTVIGEHGVRLSGGQRQRLSIARAMLKNAPILLLDEATSALDTESEAQVQDALTRLMAGRT